MYLSFASWQANLKELTANKTVSIVSSATASTSSSQPTSTIANTKPSTTTIKLGSGQQVAHAGGGNGSKNNQAPTILNKGVKTVDGQKVVLQSSSGANAQSIVKLSPSSQIRAVNVTGKGVQYVRVLTSGGSASSGNGATKMSVSNGRQTPMIVQRKIVPTTSSLGGTQKSVATSIVKTPQFVTKKLEVMPLNTANTIASRSIKKEAGDSTNKPIVLNSSLAASSSESRSSSFAKSEPTSPTQMQQKVIYRSYKLDDEQKSNLSNSQQQTTTLYSNLKLPSPEPAEGKAKAFRTIPNSYFANFIFTECAQVFDGNIATARNHNVSSCIAIVLLMVSFAPIATARNALTH